MTHDKYCIKSGYKINPKEHPTDLTEQIKEGTAGNMQKHVYEDAVKMGEEYSCESVLDIGCGAGFKLIKYFKNYKTLGLEIAPNYKALLRDYPDRKWSFADYTKPLEGKYDLVICADVLEHLMDPDIVMKYILIINPKAIALSVPARELLPKEWRRDDGPPFNNTHIREWTADEFVSYVSKWFKNHDIEHYTLGCVGVAVKIVRKDNSVSTEDLIEIMKVIFRNFFPAEACSLVSWRLIKIARELDLEARMCGLTRPSCDPIQGHSVCEIKIEGQWVCFDPAYNVCLCRPAEEFDDDCFIFYPEYIKGNHYDEFIELFSNITYHY